jgi:hypothetical protein
MRLVITGTRNGHPDVERWMSAFGAKYGVPELTVLGDARGVDAQAFEFVNRQSWSYALLRANWKELGDGAGRERNERMIALASLDDWGLAFPGKNSPGTYHCLRLAEEKGLLIALNRRFKPPPKRRQRYTPPGG